MNQREEKKRWWHLSQTTHNQLRNIAKTLNAFNIIEISIVLLFCFLAWDLLTWYKTIMTVEAFNGIAFWGAITGIVGAIFTAIKHINDTFKNR